MLELISNCIQSFKRNRGGRGGGRHTGKVTRVADDNSAAGLELIESGRHDDGWIEYQGYRDINRSRDD